jgi:thioredoxin 1
MGDTTGQKNEIRLDLTITAREAGEGATKLLVRNNKRLQVTIPQGVTAGSVVKLSNALQVTDGRPGDILIEIKIKAEDIANGATGGVVVITDATFENEVLKSSLPTVVDFWAPWCGPCRMMAPVMDQAAIKYRGRFKFCKINVDENPSTASQYQAMSIPMLLIFKNGQVADRSVGAISTTRLEAWLEKSG